MSGYIGTQPVPQATQTRDSFTATSGQTSFATGGYTPNFLDVYLNGVKLASADYTASNGSDVVLASGAALSDILEVVAYTAFDTANVTGATNFTVTGAFTSQGIDDNANATALTIDASENVLVGTTDSNVAFTNTVGIALKDGHAQMSQDGNGALYLNRKGTDGGTQYFHKDGTAVGGIGVSPDGPAFGTASQQVAFHANKLFPCQSYGSALDNTIDLGYSGSRFKDLYLSGGVYLGGTGASNKLDDYEEGSYIAGFATQNGSIALLGTHNTMNYTKIGRQVTITGRVVVNTVSGASGWVRFSLPFTNVGESEDEGHTILNVTTYNVNGIGTGQVFAEIGASTSYGILLKTLDNAGWAYLDASGFAANDIIYMNGTYLTNS